MELSKDFVNDLDVRTLSTFVELMDEISYAWEHQYGIRKDASGVFCIHKLYVGQNWAQYKSDFYKIAPGVYDKLCLFYELTLEK
jgi:hypothetical protein